MRAHVLVLNSGSSSLKFGVIEPVSGERSLSGLVDRLGTERASISFTRNGQTVRRELAPSASTEEALARALDLVLGVAFEDEKAGRVVAVGHRVVHGGERFSAPTIVDHRVLEAIDGVSHLAPLHNPPNLAVLRGAMASRPDLPHVAVFDTAFHQSMPEYAYRYAVPEPWYQEHGVRKYGFHGTSHHFVAQEAARILGRPLSELGLVTAHLGNGASATAIDRGRAVDTTMGMTPLSGLVMGTRSGDVDPGAVLYMAKRLPGGALAVEKALNTSSGLLGLSGKSNDVRTLLEAEAAGDTRARLALDTFCYRLSGAIAALTVALERLDALVFTGGIGENAESIRRRVVGRLRGLGIEPEGGRGGIPVLVVPTDEELMIARSTHALVEGSEDGPEQT